MKSLLLCPFRSRITVETVTKIQKDRTGCSAICLQQSNRNSDRFPQTLVHSQWLSSWGIASFKRDITMLMFIKMYLFVWQMDGLVQCQTMSVISTSFGLHCPPCWHESLGASTHARMCEPTLLCRSLCWNGCNPSPLSFWGLDSTKRLQDDGRMSWATGRWKEWKGTQKREDTVSSHSWRIWFSSNAS